MILNRIDLHKSLPIELFTLSLGMEKVKKQILSLLSSTPICTEELFELGFKPEIIFKAISQLEKEGKVNVQKGELAYITLQK